MGELQLLQLDHNDRTTASRTISQTASRVRVMKAKGGARASRNLKAILAIAAIFRAETVTLMNPRVRRTRMTP